MANYIQCNLNCTYSRNLVPIKDSSKLEIKLEKYLIHPLLIATFFVVSRHWIQKISYKCHTSMFLL